MHRNDRFGLTAKINPRNEPARENHRYGNGPIKQTLSVGRQLRRLPKISPVQKFSKHTACTTCSENRVSTFDGHIHSSRCGG